MTSISKLQLKGIRSFSPNSTSNNTIEFFKPLTIILGANGAGKTTILEACRYACSGSLPPNVSRGALFVHDPKLEGVAEVRAQIKLKFTNMNGREMIIVRNMQVVQKPTKLEFKVIDGSIATNTDTGERVSQSYRCADLDKEMPTLLGASKAVLESVIFCHQEEANWPLYEGKALKERFDDIFAATRYTKALEAINKTRKEAATELRVQSKELDTYAALAASASEKRVTIATAKEKAEEVAVTLRELDALEDEARKQLQEAQNAINEASNLEAGIAEIRARAQAKAEQAAEAQRGLRSEFTETNEELTALVGDLEARLAEADRDMKQAEVDVRKAREAAANANSALMKKTTETASLKAKAEAVEDARKQLERELGRATELAGLDPSSMANPVEAVLNAGKEAAQSLEAERQRATAQEETLRSALDEWERKKSQVQDRIRLRQDALVRAKQQRTKARDHLRETTMNVSRAAELSSLISKTEVDMKEAQGAALAAEGVSTAATEARDKAEGDVQALEKELESVMAIQAGGEALVRAKEGLSKAKTELERLEGDVVPNLRAFLAESADEDARGSADGDHVALIKGFPIAVDALQMNLASAQDEFTRASGRAQSCADALTSTQSQLTALTNELAKEKASLVADGVGEDFDAFPQVVSDMKARLEKNRASVARLHVLKESAQNDLDFLRDEHSCPTCNTQFVPDSDQLNKSLEYLAQSLAEVPKKLPKFQAKVDELTKALEEAETLARRLEVWKKRVDEDEPSVQAALLAAQEDASATKTTLEERQAGLAESKKAMAGVEGLQGGVAELKRAVDSMTSCQATFDAEMAQREAAGLSETDLSQMRPVADVRADQARARGVLEKARADEVAARASKETTSKRLNELSLSLEKLRGESQRLAERASQDSRFKEEVTRVEAEVAQGETELQALSASLQEAKTAITAERAKYDKVRRDNRTSLSALETKSSTLRNTCHEVKSLHTKISEWDNSPAAAQASRAAEILTQARSEESAAKKRVASAEETLVTCREQWRQTKETEELLQANLSYRLLEQEANELAKEAQDAAQAAGLKEVPDMAALQQSADEAQTRLREIERDRGQATGTLEVYEQARATAERDLRKDELRGIDERRRQAQIENVTQTLATKDLEKYHKALEKALLNYHVAKMTEINKIIRELWQSTYRGSDIDTVEIRAETERSATRAYKYRVVMIKNGTELDMAGRCSAGQRVITCLIIRLALAEVFGVNCGILALDEPTTNLDRNNIESFAASLSRIIASRRRQNNFQLLVITHDEEFVTALGRSDVAEYYYLVSKDAEQHSMIERKHIRELV